MLDAMASSAVVSTPDDQHIIPNPTWSLAELSTNLLTATFADRGHYLSAAHWGAFEDIVNTLAAMADGVAEPHVYYAPVSPGLGKSTAVQAFARALTTLPDYQDTGMVVCVSRVKEAADYAVELAEAGIGNRVVVMVSPSKTSEVLAVLAKAKVSSVAVVTANRDDPRGEQVAASRQILVTTQARVAQATRQCGFRSVAAFQFKGAARSVVAWEESFSFGREVTIDHLALAGLWTFAERVSVPFLRALEAMTVHLSSAEHNALVDVPDWTAEYGVEEGTLAQALDAAGVSETDERRSTVSALFIISGQGVRVFHARNADERAGKTLISYKDTLPADLLPILVLDGSTLVSRVSENHIACRNARKLRPAQQNYANLRVHLWLRGGGKTAFRNNGDVLIRGIAETISRGPAGDHWLIVHHRGRGLGIKEVAAVGGDQPGGQPKKVDGFEAAVRAALPAEVQGHVHFGTWGSHRAENQFKDCAHVILAGTLFMPEAAYVALTHSSMDRSPAAYGLASPEDIRAVRDGEYRDALLQAALRGRARLSDEGSCASADVYIIAARTSGIPAAVPETFPGCQIRTWSPVEPEMKGKLRDAATTLAGLMEDGALDAPGAVVTYGQICERLPTKSGKAMRADAFIRDIANSPVWQAWLVSHDLVQVAVKSRRGKPTTGVGRTPETTAPGEAEDQAIMPCPMDISLSVGGVVIAPPPVALGEAVIQ